MIVTIVGFIWGIIAVAIYHSILLVFGFGQFMGYGPNFTIALVQYTFAAFASAWPTLIIGRWLNNPAKTPPDPSKEDSA